MPTFTVNFAIGGFAMYASPDETLVGGGPEVSGQAIIGLTTFPSSAGGNWSGIKVDGFLQPQGGAVMLNKDLSGDGVNDTGGFFSIRGGLGVGYTYLHMNDLDMDYKQRGIGVALSWRVAEQQMWTYFRAAPGASLSAVAHGPSVELLFPSYSSHRGVLDYKYINCELVFWSPTNDANGISESVTMLQIGSGATF